MLIDTHCHLNENDYDNINEVIDKMSSHYMIASGSDNNENKKVIKLINVYNNIYGTIGIHPNCIGNNIDKDIKYLEENIKNEKVVAIGEIGLDYHYDNHDKEIQKEIFIKQIKLATKYNKPIVIHSRDAFKDTYEIIEKYCPKTMKITFHCYSYSKESAVMLQKYNVKFGISGVVTFKNNKKLKEVVEYLSLNDLLSETDSPYLTPEPYRGKCNEPYNVSFVVKKISEIKNIDENIVKKTLIINACEQYNINL